MTTCISSVTAVGAGLPIIGKGAMQSASHVVAVNLFYGDLWVKCRVPGGGVFNWRFASRTFHELALAGASHEALLGMDIFSEGILLVHGPERKTTFSW